jgi:hypothetical protein
MSRGPLQGPAEQWAEELADLALSDGISAFILGSDDPDDLRRFAGEVAPAVRELVVAERAPGRSPVPAAAPVAGQAASAPRPAMTRGAFAVVPTPDDGKRRSSTQVWDESVRPIGPAPDPGRTYTAHDQAAAQQLIEVHNALRTELGEIYNLIDQVAAGTMDVGAARSHINQMTMRQNNWTLGTYCESYCRIVTLHHTIEDQSVFPHLRRGDPRIAPVIDRLQQEHHVIHDVLDSVDQALVGLVATADAAGIAKLRDAADLLSDSLLSHLSYEERELAEPIARLGMG